MLQTFFSVVRILLSGVLVLYSGPLLVGRST